MEKEQRRLEKRRLPATNLLRNQTNAIAEEKETVTAASAIEGFSRQGDSMKESRPKKKTKKKKQTLITLSRSIVWWWWCLPRRLSLID